MTTALTTETARSQLDRAVTSCLVGLSPNTQRAYRARISHFAAWCAVNPAGRRLDRESVGLWAQELTVGGQSGMAVNQALSAVKRLSTEAANLGWVSWEQAVQIQSLKSRKYRGIKTGTWLTIDQVREFLRLPDRTTLPGMRDAVVLALLTGCGLRRQEACDLETAQCQWTCTPTGPRMLIRNLKGKGNRVRTLTVPAWAAEDIRVWTEAARITDGKLLRSFK